MFYLPVADLDAALAVLVELGVEDLEFLESCQPRVTHSGEPRLHEGADDLAQCSRRVADMESDVFLHSSNLSLQDGLQKLRRAAVASAINISKIMGK